MILEGVVGSFCDNDVWKWTGNKASPSLRKEGRGDGSREVGAKPRINRMRPEVS